MINPLLFRSNLGLWSYPLLFSLYLWLWSYPLLFSCNIGLRSYPLLFRCNLGLQSYPLLFRYNLAIWPYPLLYCSRKRKGYDRNPRLQRKRRRYDYCWWFALIVYIWPIVLEICIGCLALTFMVGYSYLLSIFDLYGWRYALVVYRNGECNYKLWTAVVKCQLWDNYFEFITTFLSVLLNKPCLDW
jgi:hypothetical protein